MNHPLLNTPVKALIYTILWILAVFVCQYFPFGHIAEIEYFLLPENILLCFLQYAISIGLWYVIKYNRIEDRKITRLSFTILALGIGSVIFWILIPYLLINLFFGKEPAYQSYFINSLQNKMLAGTIFYGIFTLLYYLIIYYQNFKENIIRQNQLLLKLNQQELAQLKAQINPHFLFNSLNSISYLIYENKEKAHEAIIKLSDFFRMSLNTSPTSMHALENELDYVKKYLEIEKYRFEEKLEISIRVDENCKALQVPAMILQPIIENAIKHGVYESSGSVHLKIEARLTEQQCLISIENNYEESLSKPKGNGVGLKNTAQRLYLHFAQNDLMKIEKTENSFKVSILIPQK